MTRCSRLRAERSQRNAGEVNRAQIIFTICISLLLITLLVARPTHAQTPPATDAATPPIGDSYDVFLNSTMEKTKPGLYFVDAKTGLSTVVVTNGTQHTLIDGGVLYREADTGAVKVAYPDGHSADFAPLQGVDTTAEINWAVSPDLKRIAWTVTTTANNSLLSDLYISAIDGSEKKLALHTSSTKNIDTIPLAVASDGSAVYYSRQAQQTAQSMQQNYQLFPVSGDVYRVDVATGQTTELPDQAQCACAVTFGLDGRLFARLETNPGGGFGFHLWDLTVNLDTPVSAPNLSHKQAGYPLLSADGTVALYTSARGAPPARGVPPERYVLVLVDFGKRTQQVLTDAMVSKLRAISIAPDNSSAIVVGADKDGTYKISLKDGTLLQVSAYTFLGTITDA